MRTDTHKWTDERREDRSSERPTPDGGVAPGRPVRDFMLRVLLPMCTCALLCGLAAHTIADLLRA